jgi:glycosyltransferase involved in cell wall biosynthesis
VDKVLQAIARVDGVGLVVIGDGAEHRALEDLARSLGLVERVYFAGARSKAETLALMATCDLFVLNSTYEGFPHVVLEAMALGLPVVATAVGGTPEVVANGRNGRLIPASDGDALQDALSTLTYCPRERQRLVDGARETVERFRHARMVEETAILLETIDKG